MSEVTGETMDKDNQRLTTVLDVEIREVIERIAREREWSMSFVLKKIITQAAIDFNKTGKIIGID